MPTQRQLKNSQFLGRKTYPNLVGSCWHDNDAALVADYC